MGKPVGVRIVRGDTGEEVPCELVHIGDVDGADTWEIAGVTFRVGLDRIEMDALPERTSIQFGTNVVPPDA